MARLLHLTTPLTHGADVSAFQRSINARLLGKGDLLRVAVDGQYGPATADAKYHAAYLLGVLSPHANPERCQTVVSHPSLRTPAELIRAAAVNKAIASREHSGATGAVHLALQLAGHAPPYTESPAGSNTDHGGIIDIAQREVGIRATFYCGAGVHYMIKHGGGKDITPDVRYCPSIIAHAQAGTGGLLKWMPVSQSASWEPGDIMVFEEGGIAGHTELLIKMLSRTEIDDVGWNTSSNDGGSQSNGGGIFGRARPVRGSFPVMGAARVRW